MTQEEKINLVLTDTCGRLTHGVIAKNCRNNFDVSAHMLPDVNGIKQLIAEYDLKPYLRPMSSMTEEETKEYAEIWANREPYMPGGTVDFFNAHHLDYRGLIPMGLALDAPDGMYNN